MLFNGKLLGELGIRMHFFFPYISYRTFLSEDAGPGTLVATIHAKDPDGDGVLYLITGGNEKGNFELDSHKGKERDAEC